MASKKESTFKNMVVVLLIVSAVAATSLAFIYQLTKNPIAKAKLEKDKKAVRLVVPDFDNDPVTDSDTVRLGKKDPNDKEDKRDKIVLYPAKKEGKLVGTAVKSFSDIGFTERIKIMVGFTPDGAICVTSVLEHKETPGLGDKMQKDKTLRITEKDTTWWSKQFIGKIPKLSSSKEPENIKVKKDGGEIDAITAATITSRAFCDAVNRAYITYKNEDEQEGQKAKGNIHYVLFILLGLGALIFIFSKIKM